MLHTEVGGVRLIELFGEYTTDSHTCDACSATPELPGQKALPLALS